MALNANMSPALADIESPQALTVANREWITIRRLHPGENDLFLAHLERLDPQARRSRFGHLVGEKFLKSYAGRSLADDTVVEGLFVQGVLRGVAELRLSSDDKQEAEAAFSIETAFQGKGHGGRLFKLVVDAARNRGVTQLRIQCLRENSRIRALALRHGATLIAHGEELVAELPAHPADLASVRTELRQEAEALAHVFFEWRLARWKRWATPFLAASGMARSLGQMFGTRI
ncbi:GNAT family N-acetyltransferase [Fulvimarina sp. MAC3]|uniref:GNAT family N-acetyltransferase n=1 Tax=Fulvimarina sp. MAC3 TaxID=3148887 RepID=UPI0031FBB2E8